MLPAYSLRDVADLRPGDHLCCLYETEQEHRELLTPFLQQGLEKNEKVIYIRDVHTDETILGYLRDEGMNVEPYLTSKQLNIRTVDDTYISGGVFDPDRVIAMLRSETEQAIAQGYSTLRVTGEMTWALRNLPGSEKLIEYEAKLNDFFPNSRCLAICQYDRRRFAPAMLLDILRMYPVIIVGTQFYDNSYYVPPKDMIGSDAERRILDHWIETLTERKQLENQLRAERDKAQKYLDVAGVMLVAIDANHKVSLINQKGCEVLGYKEEQIIGKNWFDNFLPERIRDEVKGVFHELIAGRIQTVEYYENPVLTKSGEERIIAWHNATMTDEAGNIASTLGSGTDITERKRAEEEVQISHRFLTIAYQHSETGPLLNEFVAEIKDVTNCAAVGIRILDDEGNISYQAYDGFSQEFYESESPLSVNSDKCMCINVIEGNTDAALPFYTDGGSFYMNGTTCFLAIVSEEDKGETRNVCNAVGYESVALIPVHLRGDILGLIHVADTRENMVPLRLVRLLEWAAMELGAAIERVQAYEELKKHQTHLAELVEERTEELRREIVERERMEAELVKSQKLEAVGVLAGGIAHDFNNILTGILGNISLAEMYLQAGEPAGKVLDRLIESEKASIRAKGLTQRLLTFSRGGEPITKQASIVKLLRESTDSVLEGFSVRCEFFIPDDLWPAEVDEGQMDQVIRNLVTNADQAMSNGGGVIRIRAENVVVDEQSILPLESGKYVKVFIEDQGVGIPEEHFSRIFDPFFTTKGKASGLGLSIAHSIVKKHHGLINVESQEGIGTTFHIYLPTFRISTRVEEEEIEDISTVCKGRVLVMDDENLIRELTTEILTNIGYEVITTTNGPEAVKVYRKAKESDNPFHAVILDLTIPGGMGGRETIKRLMEIDPDVKAIVSSGYSDNPIMTNFGRYGFKGVIVKPYNVEELRTVLHRVIEG
ncbi:MEDS domain-containing protein [Candidatus Poribacteria bacterium]